MCSAISPRPTTSGSTRCSTRIADNAELLAKGDDNGFMNKLALAVPGAASRGAYEDSAAKRAEDERSRPERPQPHPPGAAEGARGQSAGKRPDGGDAEAAVRQGLICPTGEGLTIVDPFAHTPDQIPA